MNGRNPKVFQNIKLKQPAPELFNNVAYEAAQLVAQTRGGIGFRNSNKSTQLRRFYDELVMWDTRVNQALAGQGTPEQRLKSYLPFIRMMNAKAAYAEGRKLVNRDFKDLLEACLKQVEDPATLYHCRIFFEAFMGFYKAEKPN